MTHSAMHSSNFFAQNTFSNASSENLNGPSVAPNQPRTSSQLGMNSLRNNSEPNIPVASSTNGSVRREDPLTLTSIFGNLQVNGSQPLNLTDSISAATNPVDVVSQELYANSNSPNNTSYLLKVSNVPQDITLRECHTIFALATGVMKIELQRTGYSHEHSILEGSIAEKSVEHSTTSLENDQGKDRENMEETLKKPIIESKSSSNPNSEIKENEKANIKDEVIVVAKFESLSLVSTYANILGSKNALFGPMFPFRSQVEVVEESSNKRIPYKQSASTTLKQGSLDMHGSASVSTHPIHISPLSNKANMRPPLTSHRSAFTFSDPFSTDPRSIANNATRSSTGQQTSSTPNSINVATENTNPRNSNAIPLNINTNGALGDSNLFAQQDLTSTVTPSQTRDTGKALLMMESDDINESIWGSNGITSSMSGFNYAPPQPNTPFLEWGSNQNSRSSIQNSSSFFMPPNPQSALSHDRDGNISGSSISLNANTHNRMSINNIQDPLSQYNGIIPSMGNTSTVNNIMGGSQDSNSSPSNLANTKNGNIQILEKRGTFPQANLPSALHESMSSPMSSNKPNPINGMTRSGNHANQSACINQNKIVNANTAKKSSNSSPSPSSPSVAGSTSMTQADLALLAKVPPPANPADQNPPCNTLYVGNLPPDAAEHELRQLFSSQEGFRRLSFRNKNSNGHGHGPMCFVEFEDVAFATRALAELYGSQLPRSNASNKGGIRLSFSKNPLGVRGPNSRKNGTHNGSSSNLAGGVNPTYSYGTNASYNKS